MDKIEEIARFYFKPFVIILILIVLRLFFFGTYFEEYEGMFSAFVKGVYTSSIIHGTDVNIHFIIMKIYFFINRYFPNYQIYGLVLVIYNLCCLMFSGLIIYRILTINLKVKNSILFILLFSLISADTLLNLSTTRIAFLGCFTLIGFIESVYFEKNKLSKFNWILIVVLTIFFSLLRAEVVFISGVIYALLLLVFKRFKNISLSFSFLLFGFLSFASHYFIMTNLESEPKKVYYTHEKDLLDRSNMTYTDTSIHSLDLKAFLQYGISDKELYTENFYDSKKINNGMLSILNGFTLNAFVHSIRNSFEDIDKSKTAIISFIFISVLFLSKLRKKRWIFLFTGILFFPLLVCFNTVAPARFLVPYYISFSVILVFLYTFFIKKKSRRMYLVLFLLNLFIYFDIYKESENYKRMDHLFINSMKRLELVSKQNLKDNPIIINTCTNVEKFFPVNPFMQFKSQNVLFLNLYMLNSYEFYINKWESICNCNALSISEKMSYLSLNKLYLIIDENNMEFMQYYFLKKFKINIEFQPIEKFDNDLFICVINQM